MPWTEDQEYQLYWLRLFTQLNSPKFCLLFNFKINQLHTSIDIHNSMNFPLACKQCKSYRTLLATVFTYSYCFYVSTTVQNLPTKRKNKTGSSFYIQFTSMLSTYIMQNIFVWCTPVDTNQATCLTSPTSFNTAAIETKSNGTLLWSIRIP